MIDLFLDVRRGATVDAVLGALVEAGASLETIDAAVATLGHGEVRLQVQAAEAGSVLRLRAPHGAPTHETWRDLRPRVAMLALDEAVIDRALAVLDALFAARAKVHGVAAEDVDVDPLAGPDDLADAIALAAALHSLEVAQLRATPVGHGTGTMRTIEGEVLLPGPVVDALLDGRPVVPLDVQRELVDPVGAALLAALTAPDDDLPGADEVTSSGRGRLPDGSSVQALALQPATTARPA